MIKGLLSVCALSFMISTAQAEAWKTVSFDDIKQIAEETVSGFGAKIDIGRKVMLNKKNLQRSKEARQNDLENGVYFAARPIKQSTTELKIIETLFISSEASLSGETEQYRTTYKMTKAGEWSGTWKVEK